MEKDRLVGILGCLCSSVGTLFSVLALSLNKWEHTNSIRHNAYMGLWKGCADSKCEDVSDRGVYDAVRALMFVGFFGMLATCVCTMIANFVARDNKMLCMATTAISAASGLFLMCAFGVYADNIKVHDSDYGSCFALTVVAWILAWVITALHLYKYQRFPTIVGEDSKLVGNRQAGGLSASGPYRNTVSGPYQQQTVSGPYQHTVSYQQSETTYDQQQPVAVISTSDSHQQQQ